MTNYSKFEDVNAVLMKAKLLLINIEEEYKNSLHKKEISSELLVEIKDYLGNLRSSLDYLRNKVSKYNFPICKTEKEFENSTTDLETELKESIRKWQPFNGNNWIEWLSILNNKTKHITLVPQKRTEIPQINIVNNDGAGISLSGGASISLGQGASISIGGCNIFGGQTISPHHDFSYDQRLKVEKIIWVSFDFDHDSLPNGISALPFLKDSFEKITKVIAEIEAHINY